MPTVKPIPDFAQKLRLVLAKLNLSRTMLAKEIGVDKSVAARWAGGAVQPTEHHLAVLTGLVRQQVAGFVGFDWLLDTSAFASKIGLDSATAATEPPGEGHLRASRLKTLAEAQRARDAYEGLWVIAYQSAANTGRVFANIADIYWDGRGLTMENNDRRFHGMGPVFLFGRRVECILEEVERQDGIAFLIFCGVGSGRAMILDGIALGWAGDQSGTPVATPAMMFRLADPEPDRTKVRERFQRLVDKAAALNAADQLGAALPKEIRDHLFPTVGMSAPDGGHDYVLRIPAGRVMTASDFDLKFQEPPESPRRRCLAAIRELFGPTA